MNRRQGEGTCTTKRTDSPGNTHSAGLANHSLQGQVKRHRCDVQCAEAEVAHYNIVVLADELDPTAGLLLCFLREDVYCWDCYSSSSWRKVSNDRGEDVSST